MADRPLPLDDIRVIDLTVARAGPTCVRQLADWGADVIRVEPPSDPSVPGVAGERRHGSDFQNVHRNKRSLSLDLKAPEAADVLLRLVDRADVLVENMRPPVKYRLGFDYHDGACPQSPPGVRVSVGLRAGRSLCRARWRRPDRPGHGRIDERDRSAGTEPTRVGIPVADLSAGLYLAIGILVCLHDRERTGEGQWVHTSLLEAMIAMMDLQATRWTIDGTVPVQEGNHHPTLVPMGCFASADGYVNVAGPSGRLLHALCDAIGLAGLPADPRFDTGAKRSANRAELNSIMASRLRTRTTAEWVAILNDAGVPCGPVYGMDEVFSDMQVEHLEMVAPVEHPELGRLDLIRNAVTITDGPPTRAHRQPGPGSAQR